jgi:hypothetical protein
MVRFCQRGKKRACNALTLLTQHFQVFTDTGHYYLAFENVIQELAASVATQQTQQTSTPTPTQISMSLERLEETDGMIQIPAMTLDQRGESFYLLDNV